MVTPKEVYDSAQELLAAVVGERAESEIKSKRADLLKIGGSSDFTRYREYYGKLAPLADDRARRNGETTAYATNYFELQNAMINLLKLDNVHATEFLIAASSLRTNLELLIDNVRFMDVT